jgi:hypothetical protein
LLINEDNLNKSKLKLMNNSFKNRISLNNLFFNLIKVDKCKLVDFIEQLNNNNDSKLNNNKIELIKNKIDLLIPELELEMNKLQRKLFLELNLNNNYDNDRLINSYFNDFKTPTISLSPKSLNRKSIFATALALHNEKQNLNKQNNNDEDNFSKFQLINLSSKFFCFVVVF